jgi:hypothetical protein
MNEKSDGGNGGIGFAGLLQLVFITLKLLKVIDWPWILVFALIWIGVGAVALAAAALLIAAFANELKKQSPHGRNKEGR